MRAHDRHTVIKLRHDLQACQSRLRLAQTHALALQTRVHRRGAALPMTHAGEYAAVVRLLERLVEVLSAEGGAA